MLSEINVPHSVYRYPRNNRYEIHIRSKGILLFNDIIGFKHPDKISRLHEAVALIAKRRSKREEDKPNLPSNGAGMWCMDLGPA